MDRDHFTRLRSANVDTNRFADVAVRHDLYRYLRRSSQDLDHQVTEFIQAGESGSVKTPKVLADIVESVAAAIYIDLGIDLDQLWERFEHLLEPIVTLQDLKGHPVTMLYILCQKHDIHVDIKEGRDNTEQLSIASVHVDGTLLASSCSKNKKIAKLDVANQALQKLSQSLGVNDRWSEVVAPIGSKQKLNELCVKRGLPRPVYNIEEESGRSHEEKFVCSVTIATLCITGDEKLKKNDAENSAAWLMICGLEAESDDDVMINHKNNNPVPLPFVCTVWRIISHGVMRLFVFCLKGLSLLIIVSMVAKLLME